MPELETGTEEVDVEHITLKGIDGALVDAVHARPDGFQCDGRPRSRVNLGRAGRC